MYLTQHLPKGSIADPLMSPFHFSCVFVYYLNTFCRLSSQVFLNDAVLLKAIGKEILTWMKKYVWTLLLFRWNQNFLFRIFFFWEKERFHEWALEFGGKKTHLNQALVLFSLWLVQEKEIGNNSLFFLPEVYSQISISFMSTLALNQTWTWLRMKKNNSNTLNT